MNLSTVRSGDTVFIHTELIKGRSFKSAAAGVESAHFYEFAAAIGSSFTPAGVVI